MSKQIPEVAMKNNQENTFKNLREKAGLSLDEAAQILGKTDRTVRRYESKNNDRTEPPELFLNVLKQMIEKRCQKSDTEKNKFTYIDLFAGIGGLRVPFQEKGKCVFTSEWDRFARQTYAANYADDESHMFKGDIRPFAENPEQVPEHDLLLAGFPCQPFSIAGVSKKNSLGRPHGFLCDTQGTLFHDLAKIIKHHRPPAFLLENVKNLRSHDGGKTFDTIMNVLANELQYDVHTRIISSDPWVPQKRERIFIVGFRDSNSFDFNNLIMPSDKTPKLGDILDKNVPEKYTLTEKLWSYLQGYKEKHRKAGNGFGYSLFGPDDVARTLSARYYKDGSEILISQGRKRPRRLTPRECARLMGFEKSNEENFIIPVSDTQAYRQFGNAVVVPVVQAVADIMIPQIEQILALEQGEPYQQEIGLSQVNG